MHGLWWFPILWLIASEIGSALTFHDNLLLVEERLHFEVLDQLAHLKLVLLARGLVRRLFSKSRSWEY